MTTAATGPFEVHTLPSGDTVAYHSDRHAYYRDCQEVKGEWKGVGRLTAVTTAISPIDFRPDNLMAWSARLTREGVAAMASEYVDMATPEWMMDAEAIENALAQLGLRYTDVRDDAARRGTNVHELALHTLASGEPVPDFEAMTVEERGYAQGVIAWWLDTDPQVVASEYLVADLELGVAGRPDLLCRLKDGRVALVDCKTSGYLSAKFSVQLSAYGRLGLVSGYEAPDVGIVLQVAEDGSFNAVELALDDDDFLAALDVYRRAGRINGVLRKAVKS